MSDCGIYGNKNWQRAVDKASDKPAATEHGTGSGEAKCEFCGAPEGFAGHYTQNGRVIHPIPTFNAVPTPPASPTVTLDRETVRELIAVLTHILPLLDVASWRDAKSRVELLLALLRAAERHQ